MNARGALSHSGRVGRLCEFVLAVCASQPLASQGFALIARCGE